MGRVDNSFDAGGGGSSERALDLVHLARQTLGDRELEREVLQLFFRQSNALMERLAMTLPDERRVAAHTLVGSARAIGAWRVARAAEAVETGRDGDMVSLAATVAEANAMIESVLADA